jgi:hypothetical protein
LARSNTLVRDTNGKAPMASGRIYRTKRCHIAGNTWCCFFCLGGYLPNNYRKLITRFQNANDGRMYRN